MQEISILEFKNKVVYKKYFKIEMYWEHREQIKLYPLQYFLTTYVWNKQNCSKKIKMRVILLILVLYSPLKPNTSPVWIKR